MISRILYAIGGVISALIGLRFVFRLFGADPENIIASFVYAWSSPLVQPFAGLFGQDVTIVRGPSAVTQSVFDWTALIALLVYALIFGIIAQLTHVRRVQ